LRIDPVVLDEIEDLAEGIQYKELKASCEIFERIQYKELKEKAVYVVS